MDCTQRWSVSVSSVPEATRQFASCSALDHDLLMSPDVATANSLADLSGSTVAPTDWIGFSFIARIVSTSSSDSHRIHGYVWRRPIVTVMGQVTCQPFHTVRTPSSEWQVGNRVCQPCVFVWQSSCPWHVRFTNCFCWWCIIISWILILQWTQLRQRCRTDVVPCTTCFPAPFPSQQQTLSHQHDSHSGLDCEQEAIRTWPLH